MNPNYNTYGRVFVSTSPSKGFSYYNAMAVGAIDTTLEKTENLYSYNAKGKLVKVAEVIDEIKEKSSTLTGIMPVDKLSNMEELLQHRNVNIQVHFGRCGHVNEQSTFDSVLVLRDVNLTNYSISEPSTITRNKATVQESANIIMTDSYRIVNLAYLDVINQMVIFGADYYIYPNCTDNPNKPIWIFIHQGLNAKFTFSKDNGRTWTTHISDLVPHQSTFNTGTMKVIDNKVFWSVVNTGALRIYAANIDNVLDNKDIEESEFYTKTNADIRSMSQTKTSLWSCGRSGSTSLVLKTNLQNHTTDVIDNGSLFIVPATAIDALSDDFVVIVGEDDIYAVYENNDFYVSSVGIDVNPNFTSIKVFSKSHWMICGDRGIYLTFDGGKTWKKTLDFGYHSKAYFFDELVGYAASSVDVYRTIDGGLTWKKTDEVFHSSSVAILPDPNNVNNVCFVYETGVTMGVA